MDGPKVPRSGPHTSARSRNLAPDLFSDNRCYPLRVASSALKDLLVMATDTEVHGRRCAITVRHVHLMTAGADDSRVGMALIHGQLVRIDNLARVICESGIRCGVGDELLRVVAFRANRRLDCRRRELRRSGASGARFVVQALKRGLVAVARRTGQALSGVLRDERA